MNPTDSFKNRIKKHLDELAVADSLFSETYKKENKNLDDCCTYILNQVKSSGCNGFENEEIFSMAIHYYDEDNIKVGSPVTNVNIVMDHHVELTEEEINNARKLAMDKVVEEQKQKLTKKKVPTKPAAKSEQISLI